MMQKQLTQRRLKEVLDYDPEIGIFTWKKPTSFRVKGGEVAGRINPTTGHRDIGLDGVRYHASRLAYLYVEGVFPPPLVEIDHINRIPSDDKYSNLRPVSRTQNEMNKGLSIRNNSGVVGVYFDKERGKFKTQLHKRINGTLKCVFNKRFESIDAAVKARYLVEKEYGINRFNVETTACAYLKERGLI